jgi:O-antigen/teichoic acid export membrane protein
MLGSFLKKMRSKPVARNSFWMFAGFGTRLVVQAMYFLFIARALGVVQYGAFVGVTAFVQILAPFSGLGAGYLMVKHVSRDRSTYGEYWGKSLGTTAATGAILFLATLLLKRWALSASVSWSLLILVAVSDLIAFRIIEAAGQAFQAIDQLKRTAQLNILPNIVRLGGALFAFLYMHHITAGQWGWFYLASTGTSALIAILAVRWKIGPSGRIRILHPREMLEGSYFSTSLAAQTLYNDLDKSMLARMSTLEATGIYAVAYRFIDVGFTPIRSVLSATYTSFFRKGQESLRSTWKYLLRLLPVFSGYSLAVGAVLFAVAPLIPYMLGKEYAEATVALRWLALLPLLKSLHYPAADALTGAGYQGARTLAQVLIALFNAGLNLWLLPRYSWRGAAWASLASDGLLIVAMYSLIWWIMRRSPEKVSIESEGGSAGGV